MGLEEFIIRTYEGISDRAQVEDLERRCEVGPAESLFLFTDTMGDPICRIRNSPMYKMLVAELDNELVGVIQGSIKVVTVHRHPPNEGLAKVGYILGLRVAPCHRRKGIGSSLVRRLEEWFIANDVDYAYMATEKENHASVKLFVNQLGYVKFRTPAILVNPVSDHSFRISPNIQISRLKIEEAESLYRKYMGTTEFFPNDIDNILRNKLSLGTWVAYYKGDSWGDFGSNNERVLPTSWAMLSVWNSGEIFKLRLGKAPLSCFIFTKSWALIDKIFPCFKLPTLPDFFNPFGFYFMYGLHQEGPLSGKLLRCLCQFVHNSAIKSKDEYCKVIVTEVGGSDTVRLHIPHWKLLSCPEDLWCIKALKTEGTNSLHELTNNPPTKTLFVDPREV
ncbi:putative Acyl-CoA N-acyltransferase (NAT) superfamily protein [Quillaja saponaria]|uniref:Acyl-CoA N-acyltransferase (NAT) superfamily protein n=1 Tax=Quillaja saponaria TaxID=32244 RepID=A0AAD7LTY7_QUISA|nr:putative Acyl-CoA N-acyltransferase (NAT) superfamily protein [Quillaja saponaria]